MFRKKHVSFSKIGPLLTRTVEDCERKWNMEFSTDGDLITTIVATTTAGAVTLAQKEQANTTSWNALKVQHLYPNTQVCKN